jgi:DNA recombination protein RmuC
MPRPLARQMGGLGQAVQVLGQGQEQLTGGCAPCPTRRPGPDPDVQVMEARLAEVQRRCRSGWHENALRSARALSDMQERMNES